MIIILDVDSTIIDTHRAVLDVYREETQDYSTKVNNKSKWDLSDICPLWTPEQRKNIFKNPRLFEVMKPLFKAQEVTKKWVDEGHRIVLCTIHKHEGISPKAEMLQRLFPHLDEVIYIDNCKNFMDKSLIKGDVIIDDVPSNLTTNPSKAKICFGEYAWNEDWQGLRAENWHSVELIVDFINLRKDLFDINE